MASRNSSHPTSARGFTLIELLVVMGIFSLIGGITLFVSMETFTGSNFHSDRDLLITALQRARSQAIGNVCIGNGCSDGEPHGVHVEVDSATGRISRFVIFQGTSYSANDPNNVDIPANGTTKLDMSAPGSISEVYFTQLSGDVAAPGSFSLTDGTHVSVTTVGDYGQIEWTN